MKSEATKRFLAVALKELMKTKSFDKVTVKDLTEYCDINRQTFYYHFIDIRDLMEWIIYEDSKKILANNKTAETWEKGYLDILVHLKADKDFFMNLYNSYSLRNLEDYLYKITFDLMESVVEEESQGKTVSEDDKKFIADFLKYAFVGLTLDWLKRGMKDDPELLVKKLANTCTGFINGALKNCRIDK